MWGVMIAPVLCLLFAGVSWWGMTQSETRHRQAMQALAHALPDCPLGRRTLAAVADVEGEGARPPIRHLCVCPTAHVDAIERYGETLLAYCDQRPALRDEVGPGLYARPGPTK